MASEDQGEKITEKDSRRNTACRSRQTSRQRADESSFIHCFFHTLRQGISEAEQGCRGAAARKGDQGSV